MDFTSSPSWHNERMRILFHLIQFQLITRVVAIYVLATIMIASSHLTLLLQETLKGELLADAMLAGLLFAIVEQSGLLLAISYFLGLFFFLNQLYERHEMDIVFNLGVGERRLFLWLTPPMLLFSLIVGLLVFYMAPFSAAQLDNIYGSQIVRKIEQLGPGETEFVAGMALRTDGAYVRLVRIEDTAIELVEGRLDYRPRLEPSQVLLQLSNGRVFHWEEPALAETQFAEAEFYIPYQSPVPSSTLLSGDRRELYQRLAIFLSIPVSLPLALVCSRRRVRAPAYINSFLSIIVYFFYLFAIIASIGLVPSGNIAIFWLIQGSFFTLLVVLLWGFNVPRKTYEPTL